jgi:hypothetical protein
MTNCGVSYQAFDSDKRLAPVSTPVNVQPAELALEDAMDMSQESSMMTRRIKK